MVNLLLRIVYWSAIEKEGGVCSICLTEYEKKKRNSRLILLFSSLHSLSGQVILLLCVDDTVSSSFCTIYIITFSHSFNVPNTKEKYVRGIKTCKTRYVLKSKYITLS